MGMVVKSRHLFSVVRSHKVKGRGADECDFTLERVAGFAPANRPGAIWTALLLRHTLAKRHTRKGAGGVHTSLLVSAGRLLLLGALAGSLEN